MSETHERYEVLLMKAIDGCLGEAEGAELQAHARSCAECTAELADFRSIKEISDGMRARILQDVAIEPVRPAPGTKIIFSISTALVVLGALLLVGYGAFRLAVGPLPLVLKLAMALVGAGIVGFLVHVLRIRLRARGRDPYEGIDQ